MDNATRRQILERVKQLGYPNTIEALQNPQVLDQYEQQLQAQSQQQQQQPIQQPEPISFPTPPATTPNYKVPQPAQSEAKPLVMSFNETAPQLMKDGGPKDPPKKQTRNLYDEDLLMEGLKPNFATQDNTYTFNPRIEEAKKDDVKGVTPKQKVQTATTKKKIAEEDKLAKIKEDLLDQGEIKPATEGTERLKNQFIYAMDQPLDAVGSLMQRGYVPQGNLSGNYPTSSPMSDVIGAFNPVSAVMDVARVGKDLTEKETYTTLGGAAELGLHTLGVLPSVKLGKQLGKKALAESLYWGIEPIGYGVKEKLAQFPINLVKYGYHGLKGNATNVKLKTMEAMIDDRLSVVDAIKKGEPYKQELFKKQVRTLFNPKESPSGISIPTEARLDAWRTTWNKPQLFNTFSKIGDDKYVLNAARYDMSDRKLSHLVSNIEANKLTREFKKGIISKDAYDKSLKAISEKLSGNPEFKNKTFKDIEKMMDENPEEFRFAQKFDVDDARRGGAASGYLKDEGFTDVLSAADEFGVRGGFLYHKKIDADGNIHLRAHDRWDFNPWAKRGVIRNVPNANMQKMEDKNVINILRNIDPIKLLGGKPYDIENNYILDPVTHTLIRAYKTGGKKCYTCNSSKMKVLYNKANYKK